MHDAWPPEDLRRARPRRPVIGTSSSTAGRIPIPPEPLVRSFSSSRPFLAGEKEEEEKKKEHNLYLVPELKVIDGPKRKQHKWSRRQIARSLVPSVASLTS